MVSYYDEISGSYEELHKNEQVRKLKFINDNLRIGKEDLLLDVGCGPGFSSEVFNCRIIGLDPSKELLKKCSFETIQCEAEDMPFPDRHFDVVICVTSIHNFDDYRKGILEMKRVGKERFAFTLFKKSRLFESIKSFIRENFDVWKTVDEGVDLLLFCR